MNVCESVEWFWVLLLPSSPNHSGFGCFLSCHNKNGLQGPSAFPQHEQQKVTSRSFQLQCHHQMLGCNIWSSGFDSGNNKSVDQLWLNWCQWDFFVPSNRPMKIEICSLASELMHLVKKNKEYFLMVEQWWSFQAAHKVAEWIQNQFVENWLCRSTRSATFEGQRFHRKHHSNPTSVTAFLKQMLHLVVVHHFVDILSIDHPFLNPSLLFYPPETNSSE